MTKSSTGTSGSQQGSDRGPSTHKGPGGNWPSTTPGKSGRGRGNAKKVAR